MLLNKKSLSLDVMDCLLSHGFIQVHPQEVLPFPTFSQTYLTRAFSVTQLGSSSALRIVRNLPAQPRESASKQTDAKILRL